MTKNSCDIVLDKFTHRYRIKKLSNLIISVIIVALGVTSFRYGLGLDPTITIFRWLTVDGTLFTTAGAAVFVIVNLIEMLKNTEETHIWIYYFRLSSAVAESVILVVVFFSQLPFFDTHFEIFDRYDSFIMHLVIPILGITSFVINDSPIGRLSFLNRWKGTAFITVYGVTLFTLISTGLLPTNLIPYSFLNYIDNGIGIFIVAFIFVYTCAYFTSFLLSELNRKLSWMWFKDIGRLKNSTD